MDEKLYQSIPEASYLTAENAWRYRAILRYFYIQHERLRHFLFPEEIYDYLKETAYFHTYQFEQLLQDLKQLEIWKNIIPRQDTARVTRIEDFKKKRFRYQATPYTIEIERMVLKLEQLGDSFGGSLERSLFDRLLTTLTRLTTFEHSPFHGNQRLYTIEKESNESIHQTWEEMYEQFRKLTENATDYLAHLESEKVEEMMMTESFFIYKERLTDYLRNFMTALQRSSFKIEVILEETPHSLISTLVERVADYQLSIPRLGETPNKEDLQNRYFDQWLSLKAWFLGAGGRESELYFLQNRTNDTIRKITRYTQRLGERYHNFRSRRKDYLHLAEWFAKIDNVQEAHKLSAAVFGVFHSRHLFAEPKMSEDIHSEVWDHPPTEVTIKPRIRTYREKTRAGAVISHNEKKAAMYQEYLRTKEAEQQLIDELIQQDRIYLSELPLVDPYVRKTLLHWIGKCMSSSDHTAKTDSGRRFKLWQIDDRRVRLQSDDGVLELPNYIFTFLD